MLSVVSARCPTCDREALAVADRQPWGIQVEHLLRPCEHPELGVAVADAACEPTPPAQRGRWQRIAGR